MDVEINDVAVLGVIKDQPAHQLAPEAWTTAENMRFQDGAAQKLLGDSQVFGSPTIQPHFAMPVRTPTGTMWPYASLAKIHVWDGATHTDITRTVGGDYTAANTREWNGTVFGGIAIFNNGVDLPQFWATPTAGTKMANLTNFPANERVKIMRSLGSYLVGFYVIDSGTHFGHMVHWSHKAAPGTIPTSWDHTNPAVDAGRSELPDVDSGLITDALALRGEMMIYKESATWKMRFIGGRFVFGFSSVFDTSGILAPRCAALTADGTKHVVATQDDIISHNGNVATSVLTKRWRKTLFSRIDPVGYVNSFMMSNPIANEMWFCYPENGQTNPSRALIWNYKEGGISEAPVTHRNWAIGDVTGVSDVVFDADSGTYDSLGPLDVYDNIQRRKVILLDPTNSKFYQLDSGLTRHGTQFSGVLQRLALSVIGQKRDGGWIVDLKKKRLVTRIWPKVRGGPVDVRVGFQELPDGSVTWQSSKTFDPLTQRFLDFTTSGVLPALEFSSLNVFTVDGYKIEVVPLGDH